MWIAAWTPRPEETAMFHFGFDPTNFRPVGNGDCLDCEDCTGLCREVLDTVFLPDMLLDRDR